MPRLLRLLALLLPLGGAACASMPETGGSETGGPPPVILVSIDGFRPDYLDRGVTPNLNALAASGVRAVAMHPSFPSITFPNHYTLVTGLRPDRNGIVGNTMYDPAMPGMRFSLGNRAAVTDRRWWDQAEPVWVTAERHGLRSATLFWPGSEAPIHGVRPADWLPFDGAMPPDDRVDRLLSWFDRPPARRPRFATLYFNRVDHAGHEFGPDAPQTTAAAALIDQAIGRLVAGLRARHIDADIIVVSDHGMAATSMQRIVYLDRIAPAGTFRFVTGGAYAGVDAAPGVAPRATPGQAARLAAALLAHHDHMACTRRQDLPERFHYGHNPRVPAFICVADVGWMIAASAAHPPRTVGGDHGYDAMAPEMNATFLAAGPAFVPGRVIGAFDNVDVYPLVMTLLGLPPLPSDGTVAPFRPALRQ
ncbi:ectonucleotide pyrophosphatase/phosphodiesterase [Nguyenibacter sp. L1]|uniref:alkaline phosphatase family protein n=1 Tax=Nguyenibacter sp. L1 TaxID=3049350 RepID=UPI002B477DAE|nr:ectonucleotide pyrophosphatase/phosphodiesterase [Nguyenibacter sp. L1]WRH87401.1 ectonucleotide pyrophosphatase/phosphodiesterase [Nguyenibacter sp. L1]